MKKISIFGSTGCVGKKALNLAILNNFEVVAISGNNNHEEVINQARLCNPKYVCMTNNDSYNIVKSELSSLDIEVLDGSALDDIAKIDIDISVMAIAGNAALSPTFSCLGHAKRLAIATKEAIISGGSFLMNEASKKGTSIIPIDSEHNAIFQCIENENKYDINKIILTASGGPFLDLSENELDMVTSKEALKHPNWIMGKKITIDSATLINKALEMIEAAYLFDMNIEKIEPLIHPESIIHGMVFFNDGSFKASISSPDMNLPISYSLNYPIRKPCFMKSLDFTDIAALTFKQPKSWQKRNMDLAYLAFSEKKVIAFNIANEIAVKSFLQDEIKFSDIYRFVLDIMNTSEKEEINSVGDIFELISQVCGNQITRSSF